MAALDISKYPILETFLNEHDMTVADLLADAEALTGMNEVDLHRWLRGAHGAPDQYEMIARIEGSLPELA